MTSKFEKAFSSYADVLNAKFTAARAAVSDSDVKGEINESIVKDFLSGVVPHWYIAEGCQILDTQDKTSDECDICVCNENQFFLWPSGGVVIAEGVDFVVQVKALLTDSELDRIIKNCESVKDRIRSSSLNDKVRGHGVLPKEKYVYIPYIVFAYSSELMLETLTQRISEKSSNIDITHQPDAIFVLDRGVTLINTSKASIGHEWSNEDGTKLEGWCGLESEGSTLLEFVRYCMQRVPRIEWVNTPINHYLPLSKYRGYSLNSEDDAKK